MKKSTRQTRPGLKSSQKIFFSRGIKSLQQKWAKCIELLGDTLKNKKKYFFVISCFFLTQVDKLLNTPIYLVKHRARFPTNSTVQLLNLNIHLFYFCIQRTLVLSALL
jgi:hypothetical protein